MDYVHMETDYVSGLAGRSGDPSPVTAHGVFRAIQASAKERWGSDDLSNTTVAVQGCGHVGYYLAKELHEAGAKLVVTDIDADRVKRVVERVLARAVLRRRDLRRAGRHLRALCARRDHQRQDDSAARSARSWRARRTTSCSRSVTATSSSARNIMYAPDYVANAGGVINVYSELAGWTSARSFRKADEIYDTVLKVFEIAKTEKIPTYLAADRLAEQRIHAVGSMVRTWPQWPNK